MIRKNGNRFSEKITLITEKLARRAAIAPLDCANTATSAETRRAARNNAHHYFESGRRFAKAVAFNVAHRGL